MPRLILIDAELMFYNNNGSITFTSNTLAEEQAKQQLEKVMDQLVKKEGHSVKTVFFGGVTLDEEGFNAEMAQQFLEAQYKPEFLKLVSGATETVSKRLSKFASFFVDTEENNEPKKLSSEGRCFLTTEEDFYTVTKVTEVRTVENKNGEQQAKTFRLHVLEKLEEVLKAVVTPNEDDSITILLAWDKYEHLNNFKIFKDKVDVMARNYFSHNVYPPLEIVFQADQTLNREWYLNSAMLTTPLPLGEEETSYTKLMQKDGYVHVFEDYIDTDSLGGNIMHANRNIATRNVAQKLIDAIKIPQHALEKYIAAANKREEEEEEIYSNATPKAEAVKINSDSDSDDLEIITTLDDSEEEEKLKNVLTYYTDKDNLTNKPLLAEQIRFHLRTIQLHLQVAFSEHMSVEDCRMEHGLYKRVRWVHEQLSLRLRMPHVTNQQANTVIERPDLSKTPTLEETFS